MDVIVGRYIRGPKSRSILSGDPYTHIIVEPHLTNTDQCWATWYYTKAEPKRLSIHRFAVIKFVSDQLWQRVPDWLTVQEGL